VGLTDFTNGLALSQDGAHLYATSMLGDSLTVFQRNPAKPGKDNECGTVCP
jgi:sugar lactone lactonase YvrE